MHVTRGPDNNWLHDYVITHCPDTFYAGCTVPMHFMWDDAQYDRKTTILMRFTWALVREDNGVVPDAF